MKIILVILFPMVLLFTGCIDDPVQQNNNLIKGNVYNGQFSMVLDRWGQITDCDWYGNFELIVTQKPYDIIITEKYYWLDNRFTAIYSGLNIKTLNLTHYGYEFSYYNNNSAYEPCSLKVNFPALNEIKTVITKFISDEDFYQENNYNIYPQGSTTNSTMIFIPPGKNFISGKMYYLEASFDTLTGYILSYDKFGIKNLTFIKGENPDITFIVSELINPADYNLHYEINLHEGLSLGQTNILIANNSKNRGSDCFLYDDAGSSGNAIVPFIPDADLILKLNGSYSNGFGEGMFNYYALQGNEIIYTLSPTVIILNPQDGAENVDDNTVFEIEDNDGPAIYQFCLFFRDKYINLFTENKKNKFSEFKTWNIEFPKNTQFNWAVRKFSNYKNIDEFTAKSMTDQIKSDYVEETKGRIFKTAP